VDWLRNLRGVVEERRNFGVACEVCGGLAVRSEDFRVSAHLKKEGHNGGLVVLCSAHERGPGVGNLSGLIVDIGVLPKEILDSSEVAMLAIAAGKRGKNKRGSAPWRGERESQSYARVKTPEGSILGQR